MNERFVLVKSDVAGLLRVRLAQHLQSRYVSVNELVDRRIEN